MEDMNINIENLFLFLAGTAIGAFIVGLIALYAFSKLNEIVFPFWRK